MGFAYPTKWLYLCCQTEPVLPWGWGGQEADRSDKI